MIDAFTLPRDFLIKQLHPFLFVPVLCAWKIKGKPSGNVIYVHKNPPGMGGEEGGQGWGSRGVSPNRAGMDPGCCLIPAPAGLIPEFFGQDPTCTLLFGSKIRDAAGLGSKGMLSRIPKSQIQPHCGARGVPAPKELFPSPGMGSGPAELGWAPLPAPFSHFIPALRFVFFFFFW